ncbi:hypothetical protein [Caballeronia terrestris]|uniref:hypothetical protein n=1 Tax=Caballeronia terrestris TaxID=1226301 RepID=UPI000F73C219|nr:hypothetical protein [Caballeronia terrestris]
MRSSTRGTLGPVTRVAGHRQIRRVCATCGPPSGRTRSLPSAAATATRFFPAVPDLHKSAAGLDDALRSGTPSPTLLALAAAGPCSIE